ncbi:UNVERIFIED_CONTAM: hypothetical protein FKN15_060840 [Acipenser sinensis]
MPIGSFDIKLSQYLLPDGNVPYLDGYFLFQETGVASATDRSQVILERMTWPTLSEEGERDDEDEDHECSPETKCRITGFFRRFFENDTDIKFEKSEAVTPDCM